jgi:tetratricopeptide (TPR) repeat protein
MNADRSFARAFDGAWRAAMTAALIYGAWSAARAGGAAWFARLGDPQDLALATKWAPDDAANYAALGNLDELAGGASGQARALQLRRAATQLEPANAVYRLERAMSEDEAGEPELAEPDYLRARELYPLSPDVNRALGEFYLRQWHVGEALDAMRVAVAGDPDLRAAVFGELWRAGIDTGEVLRRGAPWDRATLVAHLDTLAAAGALDDARLVWTQIEALGGGPASDQVQSDAFQYIDALIRSERTAELPTTWAEVAPAEAQPTGAAGNLISNGSFEQPILNAGLDWRVIPVDGVFVSVDATEARDGAHSLRIEFSDPGNPAYRHTFEFVPVEANTEYDFSGYLRAADITSDTGPRFELYDAENPKNLDLSTGDIRGTTDWTAERLHFRTGPETRMLIVEIGRPASSSFDDKLSGTVWMDDVRLVKAAN